MKEQQLQKKKNTASIKERISRTTTTKGVAIKMLEQTQQLQPIRLDETEVEEEFKKKLYKNNSIISEFLLYCGHKLINKENQISGNEFWKLNPKRSRPNCDDMVKRLKSIGIITQDGSHISDIGAKLIYKYTGEIIKRTRQ